LKTLALRASYSEGFRAPSPAENGKGGLAAFTTAADPVRCALGVTSACSPGNVAIITSPNPDLKPEKSTAFTLGFVADPLPGLSFSVDYWEIQRRQEINQETSGSAIAAGHVSRDPGSATATVGDPGQIVAILANYVNSNKSTVKGVDLDLRQTFNLGASGKLGFSVNWTHLFSFVRLEADGTRTDFAGTHGNCDVTNCIGTPADRINFGVNYDLGALHLSSVVNYRDKLRNTNSKADTACATTFADGTDAPAGCKIAAFTTVDLTGRWEFSKNFELYGSVQNLTNAKPPLDPLTYGAQGYNPLDYSGAVGRFYSVGAKYKF
jgi:iron complex outermembrane receptor protein